MKYLGPNQDLDVGSWLKATLEAGVLTITLNRPEQHIAINKILSLEMGQLLATVNSDDAVRVVVVCSNGSSFCTGLESAEFLDVTTDAERLLRNLTQPVVAMIHGKCHDAAIRLIESCDIVIVADDTEFALSGQAFDSKTAQNNGLVTLSLPASILEAETIRLARELADKDLLALRFTKMTLRRVADVPWDEVLNFTLTQQAELKLLQAGRPSAREQAVESFLAGKTKPGMGS